MIDKVLNSSVQASNSASQLIQFFKDNLERGLKYYSVDERPLETVLDILEELRDKGSLLVRE